MISLTVLKFLFMHTILYLVSDILEFPGGVNQTVILIYNIILQ